MTFVAGIPHDATRVPLHTLDDAAIRRRLREEGALLFGLRTLVWTRRREYRREGIKSGTARILKTARIWSSGMRRLSASLGQRRSIARLARSTQRC